jgi:hypothetical protein
MFNRVPPRIRPALLAVCSAAFGVALAVPEEYVFGYGRGWLELMSILYGWVAVWSIASILGGSRARGWLLLVGAFPFLLVIPLFLMMAMFAGAGWLPLQVAPMSIPLVLALGEIDADDRRRAARANNA